MADSFVTMPDPAPPAFPDPAPPAFHLWDTTRRPDRESPFKGSLEAMSGDLAWLFAHFGVIAAHGLGMAAGMFAFVACSMDMGFDDDSCTFDTLRVVLPWASIAVVCLTSPEWHPAQY
jgi:hypothetical protein